MKEENNKLIKCKLTCDDGFSFTAELEETEIDIIKVSIPKGLEVEMEIPGSKNNFPGKIEVPRKKIESIEVLNEED